MSAIGLTCLLLATALAAAIGERLAHDGLRGGWIGSVIASLTGAWVGGTLLEAGPEVGGVRIFAAVLGALLFELLVRVWGRPQKASPAR